MENYITISLLVLPTALLILYVIVRHVSAHTKTKIDDEIADGIGDVLKGLGKDVPDQKDPSGSSQS